MSEKTPDNGGRQMGPLRGYISVCSGCRASGHFDDMCPHCGDIPFAFHKNHWLNPEIYDKDGMTYPVKESTPPMTTPASEERLKLIEEAKRLSEAASDGPWEHRCVDDAHDIAMPLPNAWLDNNDDGRQSANYAFIARARTLIPELAAALAAANEREKELGALLDEAADDIADWGAYADDYFKAKYKLGECITKYREAAMNKDSELRTKGNP